MQYYPRQSITQIHAKLGSGLRGAEVGVYDGEHADTIVHNFNPTVLYLVDIWLAYPGNAYGYTQEHWDQVQNTVQEKYKNNPAVQIFNKGSLEGAKQLEGEQLDYVYIDANHAYEPVKSDIEAWWPLIKDGGCLAGHDWTIPDVVRAVEEFAQSNELTVCVSDNGTEWWIWKEQS
jgi:hypothetical protein